MSNNLFVGFKGAHNSSAELAGVFSPQSFLLTNSFAGLKKDIDGLCVDYDAVYLFGVDKNLTDSLRIEQCAGREDATVTTVQDITKIKECLCQGGIKSTISCTPTHYLCNEAYWYLLKKYGGRAVLIHIPTTKNFGNLAVKGNEWKQVFMKILEQCN